MDLRNCTKCGRVFSYNGVPICSRCSNTDEEDFKRVKEYLYDNPGATVMEVSEETGVSEKQILRYLRESRIEIRDENNMFLDCERCGKPIKSGRFCDTCIGEMQKEFGNVIKAANKQTDNPPTRSGQEKMYTTDIRKKYK